MVESSYQCQNKDQSCWLQALRSRGVNRIAEDDNYCIEQQCPRQVNVESRQKLVHDETKDTKTDIIVNTDICELYENVQRSAKNAEDQSCPNENDQLSLDVDNFPLILLVLVLCLFVHVAQF